MYCDKCGDNITYKTKIKLEDQVLCMLCYHQLPYKEKIKYIK